MKIVRWVTVVAFLVVTANIALADGAGDPKFQTIGGGHSIILNSVTDPNFVINYNSSGQYPQGVTPPTLGDCTLGGNPSSDTCLLVDFINNTGQTWKGISFLLSGVSGPLVFTADNTADPYFTTESVSTVDGQTLISFFGFDETHHGILPADPGSCNSESGCTGPYLNGGDGPPAFDFGILVDVTDALAAGDAFTATGTASVPEPKSIVLMLAGAALLGLFFSKRPS